MPLINFCAFFFSLFFFLHLEAKEKIYVFDKISKTCSGWNSILGECFSNKKNKIRSLSGDHSALSLNGSKMNHFRFENFSARKLDLNSTQLRQGSLFRCRMLYFRAMESDFRGAQILFSRFENFSFREAQFQGAKISNTIFDGGDFSKVNFENALITDTRFVHSILPTRLVKQATLVNVKFEDVRWEDF